ncbi:hypothetical protein ZIOFF_075232 [Zingiber officinale]|uniref:Uncharacterized protein n=1 Tax=Zingiber officinale TaxID=94328 RepID=A0A8J5E8M9_ZINOF|nr:hypothetical protein ZIOFF_075232 [Zingiber officinale]
MHLRTASSSHFLLLLSCWKSSRSVLWHLGHLGSISDSITYMRHRGHPASTIDVASGLLDFCSSSDDTHELGGEIGGDDEEESSSSSTSILVDGPPLALICFGDMFSFRFFLSLRLIFIQPPGGEE